jgi:hypothetical protein
MIAEDGWTHYILACCPGELGQPVAIAVVAQRIRLGHRRATDAVELKWLEELPAGTDLRTVADHLADHLSTLDQAEQGDGGVTVVVDVSRLGMALIEFLIKAGRTPRMVEVTRGGREVGGAVLLPRRELASGLAVALAAGKLGIPPGLELTPRLTRAFAAFQTRPAVPPDPFDAAREAADDGLVLSVGLAVALAGREVPGLRGTGPSAARAMLGDYDPHQDYRR